MMSSNALPPRLGPATQALYDRWQRLEAELAEAVRQRDERAAQGLDTTLTDQAVTVGRQAAAEAKVAYEFATFQEGVPPSTPIETPATPSVPITSPSVEPGLLTRGVNLALVMSPLWGWILYRRLVK